MNLFTRNTDYAARALLYMGGRVGQRVSTVDIQRDLKLPRPFMRKILQQLQKEGYLVSVKGYNGGFTLAMPPGKIRLIDLMRIFQGDFSLSDCLFQKKLCQCVAACPLRRELKAAEKMLVDRLKGVTLADLMRP
ncbi:MAG: Rrf2 family transcriptional regulator [Candidatus Omnitrophota bacterium]